MENNNNTKKIIYGLILAAITFVVLQQVLVGAVNNWLTNTMPGLFDSTAANAARPQGYLFLMKLFHILTFVMFIAAVVTTVLMAFGASGKKGKIYAWVALGCYIGMLVLVMLASFGITPANVLNKPTVWETTYSGMFTPFRNLVVQLVVFGGFLTALASWNIWVEIYKTCRAKCKSRCAAKSEAKKMTVEPAPATEPTADTATK